jgi:hypothetical protein
MLLKKNHANTSAITEQKGTSQKIELIEANITPLNLN